jgi:hypothetical protein
MEIFMNKIFLWCIPCPTWGEDAVLGYALAEDGTGLSSHLSSNIDFSKHDMGLTSDWKHDVYKEHYPDGYELEWIEEKDLDNHADFCRAYQINLEKRKNSQ